MQNQTISNTKIPYLSTLNVLSCWCVVMLHCNGVFWNRPKGILWVTSNFIETVCYFAVPIFFMLSGITLLDYPSKYSTGEYFKKRMKKAVIPFGVWSLIAFGYYGIIRGGSSGCNIFQILDNIINNRYLSIYWFFYPLFSIYMTIPILAQITNKKRTFLYISVIGFIFVAFLPLIFSLFSISYNRELIPSIVAGYTIYPIIGYLLANRDFSKKERMIIYILGMIGWGLHFGGTLLFSDPGMIDQTFKGYLNAPAVLQACGIFTLIKYHAPQNTYILRFINWLAKRTFGIYLIHYYVMSFLSSLLKLNTSSLQWRTFGAGMVFLLSAIVIWLMQKMPIIKRIVP